MPVTNWDSLDDGKYRDEAAVIADLLAAAPLSGEDRAAVRAEAEARAWPAKELFMSLRIAATGRSATPPLFETLAVLGKEAVRRRLKGAIEALRAVPARPPGRTD